MRHKTFPARPAGSPYQQVREKSVPLSDDRYRSLVQAASAFFAAAEGDTVSKRAEVIDDIKRLMVEYNLTLEDLLDQP